MTTGNRPFWEIKTPSAMTDEEWESLCDRCGQCCLHKLEDEDTGEVFHTWIACRLLDLETCACLDYVNRMEMVEGCIMIARENFNRLHLLPETCAYRCLAERKPLPSWHYLLSGNPEAVHEAEVSVRGKAVSEENIHPEDFEDYLKGEEE